MNNVKLLDISCWHAIFTNPRQEDRANNNLRAWGVETFAPKFKERRFNEFTNKPTLHIKPLFPRYIFARFHQSKFLHKVTFTRGVHSVVSFGERPAVVDDCIISIIQSRVGNDGLVRIGEEFKPSDEVVIKDGLMRDFIGIFEREVQDSVRVMILLTSIKYQARVVVQREVVQKLKSA